MIMTTYAIHLFDQDNGDLIKIVRVQGNYTVVADRLHHIEKFDIKVFLETKNDKILVYTLGV